MYITQLRCSRVNPRGIMQHGFRHVRLRYHHVGGGNASGDSSCGSLCPHQADCNRDRHDYSLPCHRIESEGRNSNYRILSPRAQMKYGQANQLSHHYNLCFCNGELIGRVLLPTTDTICNRFLIPDSLRGLRAQLGNSECSPCRRTATRSHQSTEELSGGCLHDCACVRVRLRTCECRSCVAVRV